MKEIEVFEMWTYSKKLEIAWTAKITIEKALKQINKIKNCQLKRQKTAYLGHVLQNVKYHLKIITEGKVKVKRENGEKEYCGCTVITVDNTSAVNSLLHTVTIGQKCQNPLMDLHKKKKNKIIFQLL